MANHKLYELTNKYLKISDKDGNIIACGKCISFKPNFLNENIYYVSFDDKWFYGNTKCKIEQVDYIETMIPDMPPSFLVWDYWRNQVNRGINVDVYRDFSYDEIDPPIKPYIDQLNAISNNFRTHESCCGHGTEAWFVGVTFYDLRTLSIFLDVCNSFDGKLIIISNNNYMQTPGTVALRLTPNFRYEIIDSELTLLDKFVKRLQTKFSLGF